MNYIPKKRKRDPMGVRQSTIIRCPQHLAFVRQHECCVSDVHICEGPIEAAHVRVGTDGGIGQKPSDCYSIPLCSKAHRAQHQTGERSFEAVYHIDMKAVAARLWEISPAGKRYRLKQAQA